MTKYLFQVKSQLNFIYPHEYEYSDSLRVGRTADRIPVVARSSAPVHIGPGAHPASYSMGAGSFPGVKGPGGGVDHPPSSRAEVKARIELYIYSPFGPS